ncbi:FKBP-type peptidyl-prolyl cis-trans isomerase [Robiginitalea sp.]|uniref:FKBP-type peptidyl-prolyl cis-trans isomerase n=1 Tax=Robiginitalea sp. TaxID=1902411 RepID=UPI003C6096BA
MLWKRFCVVLVGVGLLSGCGEDDGIDVEIVPPRDLEEVAIENDAEIREYLQSHFYNYEEFENPPADFDFKISVDTLAGENAGKIPLIDQVQSIEITVTSGELALEDQPDVDHTLYYLIAREGMDENPTVADSAFLTYRGTLLDDRDFDGSFSQPVWFDLARIQGPLQGARGFTEGMPFFNASGGITTNPDGTVASIDGGVGMIIMPSGLGYFNAAPTNAIPNYSPLIFFVELFSIDETDHDEDGIPSIMEDLDGDGYLYNDNTNEEQERETIGGVLRVNFLDPDDDGDDVPTRDEIIINPDGTLEFPDSNGNGTPDYLDDTFPES